MVKFASLALTALLSTSALAQSGLPTAFVTGIASINSEISALLPASIATLNSSAQVCYFLTNSAAKKSYASALASITSANSIFISNLKSYGSTATTVSVPKITGVGASNQTIVCGSITETVLHTTTASSVAGAQVTAGAGLGVAGAAALGVAGLAILL